MLAALPIFVAGVGLLVFILIVILVAVVILRLI